MPTSIWTWQDIASPLAIIIGASTVSYPARNHKNNNIDANRCWRGGNQSWIKVGNLQFFTPCWKPKWVNRIRPPLMLEHFLISAAVATGTCACHKFRLQERKNTCMTMQRANFYISEFKHLYNDLPSRGHILRTGEGLCSRCSRNSAERHWSRTFGRLPLYGCSRKFVFTWYCTGNTRVLAATSQKHNMVSVLGDGWKNICTPPIFFWIRPRCKHSGVVLELGLAVPCG